MNKKKFNAALAIRGLTQGDAASKIGMNQSLLSELINGKYSPKLETVHRIANGLGLSDEEKLDIFFDDKSSSQDDFAEGL